MHKSHNLDFLFFGKSILIFLCRSFFFFFFFGLPFFFVSSFVAHLIVFLLRGIVTG